jgi:hypothetical protein
MHVYQWPTPTPDNYPILKRQWDLVVERDACHPSATLYCMSNECWTNTDFPRIAWECYRATKARKPAALVIWTDGGYNKDLPADFINQNADAFTPEALAALDKPLIEHEFKWWSSFPDVRLREKYTGAVRPYAAEIAAVAAARHSQTHLLETYAKNSQRLQFLEAKGKMESLRRDRPTLAGICHFNAMDTNPSPQGILDEFYERKLADAATWRETNGDTVVLSSLGFDDRCLTAGGRVTVRFSVRRAGGRWPRAAMRSRSPHSPLLRPARPRWPFQRWTCPWPRPWRSSFARPAAGASRATAGRSGSFPNPCLSTGWRCMARPAAPGCATGRRCRGSTRCPAPIHPARRTCSSPSRSTNRCWPPARGWCGRILRCSAT